MIILNINVMVLEIKIYHLKNILIKLIHTWIYINMILVPSKNWVFFGGVRNILLEREINLKRSGGGEVDVEMEGLPLFYYFTVQSHLLCVCLCVCVCVGGGGCVRFPLLLFGSLVFWVSHARFSCKSLLY